MLALYVRFHRFPVHEIGSEKQWLASLVLNFLSPTIALLQIAFVSQSVSRPRGIDETLAAIHVPGKRRTCSFPVGSKRQLICRPWVSYYL